MIIKNHEIVLNDTSPSEMARFRQIMLGIWRQQIEDDKNTAKMEKFINEKYLVNQTTQTSLKIKLNKIDEISLKGKILGFNNYNSLKKPEFYPMSKSYSNHDEHILNEYITFTEDTEIISKNNNTPPKKRNVRIVVNLGGGADIDDAAKTRSNQIKKYNPYDKLIYIEDDNLGNLKSNIETQIKEAKKQGYGKTLELSVFSHTGSDGPKGYYDPNNMIDLSKETGSEFDKGQMSLKNWGNIDYNFDEKNSIAAFHGCSSITWAEKFLSITNVKHTAGNTGTAGGFYNTKGELNRTFRNQFGLGLNSDVFMRSFQDDEILPMYLYTRGSYITNEYGTFLKQKEVYGNPTVPSK